jgi:hypothetical protein
LSNNKSEEMLQMETSNQKLLLLKLMPLAALVPMTDEALHALPNGLVPKGLVGFNNFPYRIGRESRVVRDEKTGQVHRMERHRPGNTNPNNDLYLVDDGKLLNISREHLSIEMRGDDFCVIDRNSACGFSIDGQHFGGDGKGGSCAIKNGQVLAMGAKHSLYQFRFVDFRGFSVVKITDV